MGLKIFNTGLIPQKRSSRQQPQRSAGQLGLLLWLQRRERQAAHQPRNLLAIRQSQ